EGELRELQVEMIDRFGLLPQPAKHLFLITALKLAASPLGIRKIDAGSDGGRLVFADQADIDPRRLIELIQKEPNVYRLDGQHKLRFRMPLQDAQRRIEAVEDLLSHLGEGALARAG